MTSLSKKVHKVLNATDKRHKNAFIKVWNRSERILAEHVGLKFKVHQGLKYINVIVSEEMVGFKFGEFSPTRVRHEFKKKRK
jgi:small subunit ribosomal protein S19